MLDLELENIKSLSFAAIERSGKCNLGAVPAMCTSDGKVLVDQRGGKNRTQDETPNAEGL